MDVPASLALTLPLAAVLLLLAAATAVMARRGWTGSLARSGRLGLHTPAASASDRAFAAAHKVAAPVFGGAAVIGLLAAALIAAVPSSAPTVIVVFVVGLVGVLGLLAAGGLLGDRTARAVPVPARAPASAGSGCDGCACGSGGCAGLTRGPPAVESSAP